MASSSQKSSKALHILQAVQSVDSIVQSINDKTIIDVKDDRLPIELKVSGESTLLRRTFLEEQTGFKMPILTAKATFSDLNRLEGNIENYIGMSQIPTGVIGPLRVIGSAAKGDFFVPLATSEGALVASYHRGAKACLLAGGATSVCLVEGVQRSPLYKFHNLGDLGQFVVWVLAQVDKFREITEQSSRFAKLEDMRTNIEGNHLILTFEFHTGDASGQNMVTICTDKICQ